MEVITSGVPELCTFATGIKRDYAAIMAALTYKWSQRKGQRADESLKVEQTPSRTDELGLIFYDIESWRVLHELSTGDDGEPVSCPRHYVNSPMLTTKLEVKNEDG